MLVKRRIKEHAGSQDGNNTTADSLSNDNRVSDAGTDTGNMRINNLDPDCTVDKSKSAPLLELSTSNRCSKPFRFFDLPSEIRVIIYHHAIGNRFLHIYSDCATVPDKWIKCQDDDPHCCETANGEWENLGFPLFGVARTWYKDLYKQIRRCHGSVIFSNRICTSRHIGSGDRNGYWSLSISQEVQTGQQSIEHGTRDNPNPDHAKPLDYCPCFHHTKISLTLELLRTCKKIHKEAALIPYQSNTFIFQDFETFATYFGLVFPRKSSSNDNPNFAPERSVAICTMRHIRLHSRICEPPQFLYVTRLLRASFSVLTGLQTLELTLGIRRFSLPLDLKVDDSFFGVSSSVRRVTINVRNQIEMTREAQIPIIGMIRSDSQTLTMEEKQEFAEKLMERILKKHGFHGKKVPFFGPT